MTEQRRLLFSAALEQSEQQFLAARAVGVQSRPLNLLYGLSQAGRAVAAALTPEADDYQLKGHGISVESIALVYDDTGERVLLDAGAVTA